MTALAEKTASRLVGTLFSDQSSLESGSDITLGAGAGAGMR